LVGRIKSQGNLWSEQNGCMVFSLRDGSGGYYCVQNNANLSATVTLDLSGSVGVNMTRGMDLTNDVIPPYKSMLINCATCFTQDSWSLSSTLNWKLTRNTNENHQPGIFENGFHDIF
jgi:hypothetical protein